MSERTTICPRCSTAYAIATSTWLPACPNCGRAPISLRTRVRDNRLAAVIAGLAGFTLAVGFTQPFLTMEKLGERTTFSLITGVRELFERGYVILGCVLLIFSVLFPIAKILALLLATSRLVPLSMRSRHRLHRAAELTGKYSMLDVLVVAVIIVLVRFNGMADVEAHAGTAWFCAAVLLSMLAGLCVQIPQAATKMHE
jgi:paraquat-inducible protein A